MDRLIRKPLNLKGPACHQQRRWPDLKRILEASSTQAEGKETATLNTIVWLLPSHASPRNAPYLLYTPAYGLHVGRYPPQPVSVLGTPPSPVTHLPNGSGYFPAKTFLVWYPNILKHSSFYTQLPAYEDGTDRVFRNVGIETSDPGKLPRRKHAISYGIL